MHCPSCGQQQVSNQTKFCSRCGMPLSVVAEVVANGGFLPQLAALEANKTFWTKKNGVTITVFFVITFLMLLPALFGIAGIDRAAGVSAVFGVFGGLMLLLGSLILLPSSKPKIPFPIQPQAAPQGLYGAPQSQPALPPQRSRPVENYAGPASWRDTNDPQPSVTESTTRLLNKEDR